MTYEVVDPAERGERGIIYEDFDAALAAVEGDDEVWQLLGDAQLTRMVQLHPSSAHALATRIAETPRTADADAILGRAEREASAVLAAMRPYSMESVQPALTAAWINGYLAGQERVLDTITTILDKHGPSAA